MPQETQLLCDKAEKISPSFLRLLKDNGCIVGDYQLVTEPFTIDYMKSHSQLCPGTYRGDLGDLSAIEKPTVNIDWDKFS